MAEQSQCSVGGDDTKKGKRSECSEGDDTMPLPRKLKRSCDDDDDEKEKGKYQHPNRCMACLKCLAWPVYGFSDPRLRELFRSEKFVREYIEALGVAEEEFKRRREDIKARLEKVREQKKAVSEARAALADLVWDFSSPTLVRNITKVE